MPSTGTKFRAHSFGYGILAILFLVSFADWMRSSWDRINELRKPEYYVQPPFDLGDFAEALNLQREAEAAGISAGDVVTEIEGRPLEGLSDFHSAIRRAKVGDRLALWVRTGNDANAVRKPVSIELQAYPDLGISEFTATLFVVVFLVVMPLFCIALGYWVAAARIQDRAAWLLLVLLLSISAIIGTTPRTQFGNTDALQPVLTAYRLFLNNLAPCALVFFAIGFPERLQLDRKYPWIKWVIFGPLILRVAAGGVMAAIEMHHLDVAHRYWNLYAQLLSVDFLQLVAIAGFFVILGYKTLTTSARDARRRLLLLDVAGVVGFVPPTIIVLLSVAGAIRLEGWVAAVFLTMLAFPLTMAYVIIVHRAMDVRVVVRQGMQYVLARGGIRVIQLGLIVAVSVASTSLLAGDASTSRVLLVVGGMVAIVAVGGRFADRLRGWVDRRFFREAYEADAILSDLATKVRTMVETNALLETVGTRIAASLHVPRITILLGTDGTFRPAFALGYPTMPGVVIDEQSVTVKRLQKHPHALVQFDDADSWVQSTEENERRSLEELKSELLLPLSLNEKLIGIMSLGRKQSEEPFSGTDIRLLNSVAAQTGLALENGRLTEAIAVEVASRAKEKRDLEIAREVQERLFPQEYPPVAGVDYAGACRPALGVGGDYYDFILLANGQLGIAIGDVSGKGIPAALLMATLRAYLRGAQSIHHQPDLTEVMRNLNRLVYESSAANRYATFFYAEFDPSTRVLNYVNGGHNAPMLFRGSGNSRSIVRLDTGGPVVGLVPDCIYMQGQLTLDHGDTLVAYTDGLSEAMNAADEEWGEGALMQTVQSTGTMPAATLITRLMEAADAFAAGAPQHDDMTTVVVRVL